LFKVGSYTEYKHKLSRDCFSYNENLLIHRYFYNDVHTNRQIKPIEKQDCQQKLTNR